MTATVCRLGTSSPASSTNASTGWTSNCLALQVTYLTAFCTFSLSFCIFLHLITFSTTINGSVPPICYFHIRKMSLHLSPSLFLTFSPSLFLIFNVCQAGEGGVHLFLTFSYIISSQAGGGRPLCKGQRMRGRQPLLQVSHTLVMIC